MPPYYRHTHTNYCIQVVAKLTDIRTDKCYQVRYLPALFSYTVDSYMTVNINDCLFLLVAEYLISHTFTGLLVVST